MLKMKKWWNWLLILALICLLFVAIPISLNAKSKQQLKPMFDEYIEKFNKSYKNIPAEYEARFSYFVESVQEIQRLNSESRGPEEHKARYGLTKLSDMSKAEYKEIHLSDEKMNRHPRQYGKTWNNVNIEDIRKDNKRYEYVVNDGEKQSSSSPADSSGSQINNIRRKRAIGSLPMQVDWRAQGAVGPVRDQGVCGACWAFSTVGAMESMNAIRTGKLETLSVQEIIDCAGLGNSGCAGGDICLLLDWLTITNSAVQTDKQYPLKLTDSACMLPKNATGVRLDTFTCDDLVGKEEQIITMLATHGPVAVAVNALTWQNYLGGIIQFNCGGTPAELNHAVELVGYDLTRDVPYYIAKNSWGTDFGLFGYLHLALGSNMCGLANEVASVDVK